VTPVIVKAGDDQVYGTLYHERFNPKTAALFDTVAPVKAKTDLQQPPAPLSLNVSVKQFQPGHITLELDQPAPAGSALVVSENYYPGWQATVAGKPAPTGRADLSLIGVELPEGAREVELSFSSRSYQNGRTVTVVAVLLSLLLTVVGVMQSRVRGAGSRTSRHSTTPLELGGGGGG
jgi:hypothetical protein